MADGPRRACGHFCVINELCRAACIPNHPKDKIIATKNSNKHQIHEQRSWRSQPKDLRKSGATTRTTTREPKPITPVSRVKS